MTEAKKEQIDLNDLEIPAIMRQMHKKQTDS
jgi:hypothetical protein